MSGNKQHGIKGQVIEWMDRGSMFSHILMLGVGLYLFYAVYRMLWRTDEMRANPLLVYFFAAVFIMLGLVMISVAGFALITKHYRERK